MINGDGGGDKIWGGPGADRLLGEWGGDDVYGRHGDDYLDGGSGGDVLEPGQGNDTSYGGFGGDKITDVEGNDFIDAGAAGDDIDAGPGDDIVHGGSGSDDIRGGDGVDQIYTTSSGDNVDAGAGDDFVYVNNGTAVKTVDCGPGYDTLHINPIDMRGGFSNRRSIRRGEIKADTCENILEVPPPHDPLKGKKKLTRDRGGRAKGTERNDNLLGSRGPDRLIGLGGDDIMWGNRQPDGTSRGTDRIDAGRGQRHRLRRVARRPHQDQGRPRQRLPPGRRRHLDELHQRRHGVRHHPARRPRLQLGERGAGRRHRLRLLEGPHGRRLRPGTGHGEARQQPQREAEALRDRCARLTQG